MNLQQIWDLTFVRELLEQYGQPVTDDEGHVFEYSEQDISEQLRKAIQQYLEGGNRLSNF